MMLDACLIRDRRGHSFRQRHIERGCHADRLREHGRPASPTNTVQTLVPPVVGRNPQPRDRRRLMQHLRDLFTQGHRTHECVYPFGNRFLYAIPDVIYIHFWHQIVPSDPIEIATILLHSDPDQNRPATLRS